LLDEFADKGLITQFAVFNGKPNSSDERRNLMQTTTLARYGAPIAIVAGALMIITRLVTYARQIRNRP
jgi:hypothetical protein